VKDVKYIYKYVYKGHDRAVIQLQQNAPDVDSSDTTLNTPVTDIEQAQN